MPFLNDFCNKETGLRMFETFRLGESMSIVDLLPHVTKGFTQPVIKFVKDL